MPKPRETVMDTYEEVVEWYTAYLCGVFDTMTEFRRVLYAGDVKQSIKGTVESIIKDAGALQAKGEI